MRELLVRSSAALRHVGEESDFLSLHLISPKALLIFLLVRRLLRAK